MIYNPISTKKSKNHIKTKKKKKLPIKSKINRNKLERDLQNKIKEDKRGEERIFCDFMHFGGSAVFLAMGGP